MDSIKEQSSASARSKLRYPLRSSIKPNDGKPATADVSSSSASKRGRPATNVSKSVSVLDLSGKDKYAKPPRRLSIPAKSTASPLPRPAGTITPISENRAKRPANGQRKSETPVSDASKSLNRRKFSVLSSASYWLSQIKLSESASKHSISLGFFKLGLEAGCEPLQRLREELKAYVRRHNLGELEELAKELLKSYNIMEDLEQLQISETISQVPEESSRSSDEDVHSYASSTEPRKLRLKSLNSESTQAAKVKETGKDGSLKKNAATKNRVSLNRNSTNVKSVADIGSDNMQKKSQRLSGQSSKKEKDIKNQGKTASGEKALFGPIGGVEETSQEDKENMDAEQHMEEISLSEVA